MRLDWQSRVPAGNNSRRRRNNGLSVIARIRCSDANLYLPLVAETATVGGARTAGARAASLLDVAADARGKTESDGAVALIAARADAHRNGVRLISHRTRAQGNRVLGSRLRIRTQRRAVVAGRRSTFAVCGTVGARHHSIRAGGGTVVFTIHIATMAVEFTNDRTLAERSARRDKQPNSALVHCVFPSHLSGWR